ncbi:hypothetical protein FRX31_021499, partial [Thalictrum thalictroides]
MNISLSCALCDTIHESVKHLFLNCTKVLELWVTLLASEEETMLKLYLVDTIVDWPARTGNALMTKAIYLGRSL